MKNNPLLNKVAKIEDNAVLFGSFTWSITEKYEVKKNIFTRNPEMYVYE